MSKGLVAVAMGQQYVKQTEAMVSSFLKYNEGWSVLRYYDDAVSRLLPPQCRSWTPFNKCEMGRWFAMQDALKKADTVLYCDGDMRWYGKYPGTGHQMGLTPHYVTNAGRRSAKHWLFKDGVANIGIVEMSRGTDAEGIFDFVIGETLHAPSKFLHGNQLWLQNLVSAIPDLGYDCVYNCEPGLNVAVWNLRHKDRRVLKLDGGYYAVAEDVACPLISFHFSSKSLDTLDKYGDAVKDLKNAYLRDH